MKIKTTLALFAIWVLSLNLEAQAPTMVWDRVDGGIYEDEGLCVTKAPNGYIYVGGSFAGTIMFGSMSLSAPTNDYYGFIAKFRPDSSLVWARIYGANKFPNDIAVASDGSIYVTGNGPGITTLYISKVDSNMNALWEYSSSAGVNPGSGSWYPTNTGRKIILDNGGNILTCGTFTDSLAVNGAVLYASNGSLSRGYLLKWTLPEACFGRARDRTMVTVMR